MAENLYCTGQAVLSQKARDNWDKIKWTDARRENEPVQSIQKVRGRAKRGRRKVSDL
jgi:hypothetical protein